MSRIGKIPVKIPSGVKIELTGRNIKVNGPKGDISWEHHPSVTVTVGDGQVQVDRAAKDKLARSMHGTARQLIQNMVTGVSEGFVKELDIVGVGYNAKVDGTTLTMQIGFCHPVVMPIPKGLQVEAPRPTNIIVRGVDKQLVGQFAAEIRRVRPPEPYKGKGILYRGEVIRRKAAKSFGSA
jgi:large subunit ribosomal protein L6